MSNITCRKCGTGMVVQKGRLVDVVRCPTEGCPCEGARGPIRKLAAYVARRFDV